MAVRWSCWLLNFVHTSLHGLWQGVTISNTFLYATSGLGHDEIQYKLVGIQSKKIRRVALLH